MMTEGLLYINMIESEPQSYRSVLTCSVRYLNQFWVLRLKFVVPGLPCDDQLIFKLVCVSKGERNG